MEDGMIPGVRNVSDVFYKGNEIQNTMAEIPKFWAKQGDFKTPTIKNKTKSKISTKSDKNHNKKPSQKEEADDEDDEKMKDMNEETPNTKQQKIERKEQQKLFSSFVECQ